NTKCSITIEIFRNQFPLPRNLLRLLPVISHIHFHSKGISHTLSLERHLQSWLLLERDLLRLFIVRLPYSLLLAKTPSTTFLQAISHPRSLPDKRPSTSFYRPIPHSHFSLRQKPGETSVLFLAILPPSSLFTRRGTLHVVLSVE